MNLSLARRRARVGCRALPAVAIGSALAVASIDAGVPLHLIERHVYLMGTRAVLATYAPTRAAGLQRLDAMLRVLESTEAELSNWRADTVLSRLNRSPVGTPFYAPEHLCKLFGELSHWRDMTGAAFDPAVGTLVDAWDLRGQGAIPDAARLQDALERSGLPHLRFEPRPCRITRLRDITIDAGAFGKGEALDRAAERAGRNFPWLIDLGGQVMVNGRPPDRPAWPVAIADPVDRSVSIAEVELRAGSMATSGGSERDVTVGLRRIGHVLDPRSGRPAASGGSVTVWHERGLVADILSTALYVMGSTEGLGWAETRGVAACYASVAETASEADGVELRCSPAFVRRFPTAPASAESGAGSWR